MQLAPGGVCVSYSYLVLGLSMGGFFSRKVQKSSKEILEELEKQINSKTRSRQRNQQYERSFVSYLLLLSFVIYLIGVGVLYLYFRPSSWAEWLVYLMPLIFFPIVVYAIKKLLNLYFSHRKTIFDQELATLGEEKRRVLNEVMEKETYKTAIELLQQYEPTHPSLQHTPQQVPSQQTRQQTRHNRSEARRRVPQQQTPHPAMLHPVAPPATVPAAAPTSPLPTPVRPAEPPATPQSNTPQPFIPPGMCLGAPPGPPTPCPILPRDRSKVDKVVEYLVGDGPNNRYALICQKCHSHNGMALRDEFEYISFRCAYCFHLHLAKKKRPSLATASLDQTKVSTEKTEVASEATATATPPQDDATDDAPKDTPQQRPLRQRRNHRNNEEPHS